MTRKRGAGEGQGGLARHRDRRHSLSPLFEHEALVPSASGGDYVIHGGELARVERRPGRTRAQRRLPVAADASCGRIWRGSLTPPICPVLTRDELLAQRVQTLDLVTEVSRDLLDRIGLHADALDLAMRRADDEEVFVVVFVGGTSGS
jgi:hypothetical protein